MSTIKYEKKNLEKKFFFHKVKYSSGKTIRGLTVCVFVPNLEKLWSY